MEEAQPLDDSISHDGGIESLQPSTQSNGDDDRGEIMAQYKLVERIIKRLAPEDQSLLSDRIYKFAMICGGLLMTTILFWWLTVLMAGDGGKLGEISPLSYSSTSILVPVLVVVGTILASRSQLNGFVLVGFIAGALFLLSAFYTFRPLFPFWWEDLDYPVKLWMTGRLLILGVCSYFIVKLALDAYSLRWAKLFLDQQQMEYDLPKKTVKKPKSSQNRKQSRSKSKKITPPNEKSKGDMPTLDEKVD